MNPFFVPGSQPKQSEVTLILLRDKHHTTCNGLQIQNFALTEITAGFSDPGAPQVITLIGGGGKTSLLHLWARCLKENGFPVVTTTTTKLCSNTSPTGFSWAPADNLPAAKAWIQKSIHTDEILTLIGGHLPAEGKAFGVPADWIDQLCQDYPEIIFLVEGDGSAGRSLKGHLAHEPVIPASTSLLIPVVGLDVLGQPLNSEQVHRPEVLSGITGAHLGAPIEDSTILAALLNEKGYLQQTPEKSAVLPWLNKLETFHLQKAGLQLSQQLLAARHPQIRSVVAGSIHQNCFVRLS